MVAGDAAPVWKSYLAIRSSVINASHSTDLQAKRCAAKILSGRKKTKPSAGRGGVQGASFWMTLATPLTMRQSNREDGAVVLKNVRDYWEHVSINERQQILFLDEPELVKQLYKLNLSLLCVGLMQRHLKTSNRIGAGCADNKSVAVSALMETKPIASTDGPIVQERATVMQPRREMSDTSSEKTYELLEAMEFMDISTGTQNLAISVVDRTLISM